MKLSMIYMASGFGRRFGSNKLLASLGGRPLYMYGLTALAEAAVLLQAEGTECQLITVSQYAEILEAARLLPLTGLTVENPYSEEGIAASIRLGTAAAWEDASAFLYFVADQPYTEPAVIAAFASSFLKSGKTIGCTASNGRRGSPTAFSACYRQNLMGLKGDKGGRQIMESRPDEIWIMETKADQLWDIDRAEDLDADKMKKTQTEAGYKGKRRRKMHKKDGKKNKKRGWKRKRSGKALAAAALLLGAAILFSCGFAKTSQYAGGGRGYLRSATYYSDDWVINFWNSESCHMEEELAQIAADGFNSIILAVPWREFQPQTRPISYEDYAWAKLDRVMEMAAAQDLGVILRVGYTWDYAGSDNVLTRYERLLYDEEIRSAWLSYAARLYERASAHENFCGGFLTWEDFWNFTENCAGYGNGITGRKMAKQVGYTAYARERYSLKELSAFYGTDFSDYSEIYLPEKESYARKVLFEFYDAFLQKLLKETQAVFPDLSMEVRLDTDAVKKADGSLEGVPHWNTFGCGDASYTGIMYSVPMGFANAGEKVTAEEALKKAPVLLNQVRAYNGNKPVYVDQFLFTDNTVGFEQNAQLEESEKTAYLNGMGEIFRKYTMGYGIWTYRDYGDNKLYNPQFALGLRGWKSFGGSYVAEGDEGKEAVLPSGSRISQDIRSRATGASGKDAYVRFTLEGRDGAVVTVRAGGRSQTAAAGERRTVEMKFEDCSAEELSISCTGGGTAMVDNVKVYTYITEGDLYRMDGSQDHCMEAVRQLNRTLGASQADNS